VESSESDRLPFCLQGHAQSLNAALFLGAFNPSQSAVGEGGSLRILYILVVGNSVLDVAWIEDGNPVLSGSIVAILTSGAYTRITTDQLSALVNLAFTDLNGQTLLWWVVYFVSSFTSDRPFPF
jgi:hypothetical protein